MEFRSKILNRSLVAYSKDENAVKVNTGATLLLLAVIFFAFILPAINSTKEITAQRVKIEGERDYLTTTLESYSTAAKFMNDISGYKGRIDLKVPSNPDAGDVVGNLTYYASFNNLALESLNLEKKEGGVEVYTLRFEGQYENIYNFFSTINTSDRYYKINSVSINSQEKFNINNSYLSLIVNIEAFSND